MKEYQAGDIRNFSIVGHASSGKTTLSEALLACAGEINRMGTVAAGNTVSDYHEAEQNRKVSIQSTLLHLEWLEKKFNIIDCPGYSDFICESLGALRASDFALVVVNASPGGRQEDPSMSDVQDVERVEKLLADSGIDAEFKQFVRGQSAVAEIEALVDTLHVSLLIIGLRKRSAVGKLILGSVAQELLLSVPCPVLAVKAS